MTLRCRSIIDSPFWAAQIVLQTVRQVVAVAEVKITRQIDILEHLNVSRLLRMHHAHRLVRNVNHSIILDLVDRMVTDHSHPPPLRYQNYIITLQEADETDDAERGYHFGEGAAGSALTIARLDHSDQVVYFVLSVLDLVVVDAEVAWFRTVDLEDAEAGLGVVGSQQVVLLK